MTNAETKAGMHEIYGIGGSFGTVEIDGPYGEEFDVGQDEYENDLLYLHFSDGTVIRCWFDRFDDNRWDIQRMVVGNRIIVIRNEPSTEEEPTDHMVLDGVEHSPICSTDISGPSWDEMTDLLNNYDWNSCDLDAFELMDIYKQLVWSKGKK